MGTDRLQKILSAAGVASRRAAEEMILEGRVTVNGQRVTELGAKADPEKDHVKVDGHLVRPVKVHRYLLLNKPRGVVTTASDPGRRPTVISILGRRVPGRVVPVGRLDAESEGLLLLTDDGALVQKLTHPSGGCRKEYEVKVSGVPSPEKLDRLRKGVFLDGKRTAPADVELIRTTPERGGVGGNAWVKVVLGEGRSRQIRRMFLTMGHPVSKLHRVAIGPVRDRALKPGEFRDLSEAEVRALKAPAPNPAKGQAEPSATTVRKRRAPRSTKSTKSAESTKSPRPVRSTKSAPAAPSAPSAPPAPPARKRGSR